MSRYLMTQSLLGAWEYIYRAYEGKEKEAYEDFIRVLNREPTVQTEAMLNGVEFEDAVTEYLRGKPAGGTVKQVGDIIRGAQLQVPVSEKRRIGDTEFLLYGRLDALKAGVIYDVKYSKSYEVGKYIDSPQHPMYLSCLPAAREFEYLISDGQYVYKERYTRAETPAIEAVIKDFMDFLRTQQLQDVYYDKWRTH